MASDNLDNICREWEDGREFPHFQVIDRPIIMEFIRKYPQCFEYRVNSDSWIYKRNGNIK